MTVNKKKKKKNRNGKNLNKSVFQIGNHTIHETYERIQATDHNHKAVYKN